MLNKKLLPLKVTLFGYAGAAFSVLPYLTIHMKDIGISDLDVAFIYSILPFCVFLAPPLVGFLADRIGDYKKVVHGCILLTGVFHTSLLFVPRTVTVRNDPTVLFSLKGSSAELSWSECGEPDESCNLNPGVSAGKQYFRLSNCSVSCSNQNTNQSLCSLFEGDSGSVCGLNPVTDVVTLSGLEITESQPDCRSVRLELAPLPDPCALTTQSTSSLALPADCELSCSAVETNLVPPCGEAEVHGRVTTNVIYFILRALAYMALACSYIILDAQTIQMCKMEEQAGHSGSYGQQILYKTLAQAIISPLVGVLMDQITFLTGETNYIAPFVMCDILVLCATVALCFIDDDIGIPKSDTMKGVKIIFSNINIMMFIGVTFVCGTMFGYVETFLFVFLKEDLNAPIYLLGLTITTGSLVSIPFLFYSDFIVKKVGVINIFIIALAMYGVRYVGYSFITCAWYAFPFEALEVFTLYLMRVAQAQYIKERAPVGTLATLTGLSGSAHFGFGKGCGALLGGVLKDQMKSTMMTFRVFGIAGFVSAFLYALYSYTLGVRIEKKMNERNKQKENDSDGQALEAFITKK